MKKGVNILLALIIIGLLWYFFIKPQDYQITVKAKTFPGTINQSLKNWSNSLPNSSIKQVDDILDLNQIVQHADSTFIYNWKIKGVTDSTAIIKVDVTDADHSLLNKLYVPFIDTDFEKRSRKTVIQFMEYLNKHLKEFKVTIVGEEDLLSTYCGCVEVETSQNKKARGMMENYPFLNSIFAQNGIKLNGLPFIEITDWNMTKDSIAYNFCYPIIQTDSLPEIKDLTYKEFTGGKSLKAIYNGNYITSDRAWYALLDYANKNNIEIEKLPIEFFFNNPNMGGDALLWKAEIFMPIKD